MTGFENGFELRALGAIAWDAALKYQPNPGFPCSSPGHNPGGSDLSWEAEITMGNKRVLLRFPFIPPAGVR